MGSDCGGGGSPGGGRGGSPDRNRGGSPEGNRGGSVGGNRGGSPDRNRGGSPSQTVERSRARHLEKTRDRSSSSSSTSPACRDNLLGMGINPKDYQSKWSHQQASTSGTSHFEVEQLREKLSKLQAAKERIEAATRKVFENKQARDLRKELATAERLGVKPMHVDDPGFEKVANEGCHLKWAVTESGDLLFVPHSVRGTEIAHTVLTDGRPVVATGEATIFVFDNKTTCAGITKHSGHYHPDERSLEIGKQAFKASGITFMGNDRSSGAADQQASTSNDFLSETTKYLEIVDLLKDTEYSARKTFVDVLNERVRRIEEVDNAAKIVRGEKNSNKDHHVFDKAHHHWNLTGLDRQGNWDLIQTTLLNKYEKAKSTVRPFEVSEPFGNYIVTVSGKVVNGALRISDAWVNPL